MWINIHIHMTHLNYLELFIKSMEQIDFNTMDYFVKNDLIASAKIFKWAVTWDFQQCGMCDQQSLRSACAYVQSYQSLC